jgi:hypothetical protein
MTPPPTAARAEGVEAGQGVHGGAPRHAVLAEYLRVARGPRGLDELRRGLVDCIREKCVGSSYTLGRFSLGYRKSLRIFCGYSSRRFSSVSRHVLTLDRLSLPEKRILNIKV